MAHWIFIGQHNLRGEKTGTERGKLIEPFVPFEATPSWRAQFRNNPSIDRKIMTVDDYEKRLRTFSLHQLFNETRRRKISTAPVSTHDAQWVLRASAAIIEISEGRGDVICERYDFDKDELLELPLANAKKFIVRTVTNFIMIDCDMTEEEVGLALISNLMRPIRELAGPEFDVVVDADPVADRKAEVAKLARLGVSQSKIAAELGISKAEVKADLAEASA